ncbi:Phage Tail Collar Domain protein [Marinomonas spartinae]|uniref:Phage Tail Collar Domain protein n=1 Tax=Marinomonas spartinae TaxID=1792290 RepID=A0A1A8TEC2_9GAMM|nr:tail fiber protein [Marinomonas spartinae]SBS30746.1 Phage Tail Collar Domain protein [Marinomonas spartinae]
MADPFIGEVRLFGFDFNPRGWAFCSGGLLAIATHSTLFSLLGTNYGGDGRTTFGLPDLRGRTAIAQGRHPGSLFDWRIGQIGGAETHTLSVAELASHDHTATFTPTSVSSLEVEVSTSEATSDTPAAGSYLASTKVGRGAGPALFRADAGSGTVALGGVGGDGSQGVVTVQATGGSQAFSLMQPVLVLNYCLSLQGIYPPRS